MNRRAVSVLTLGLLSLGCEGGGFPVGTVERALTGVTLKPSTTAHKPGPVAIHGDRVVLGSTTSQGKVGFVFVRTKSGWTQEAKLTAKIKGSPFWGVGSWVDIYGDTLGMGLPADDFVHVYQRGASGWGGLVKIPNPATNMYSGGFGHAVAIDGNEMVVGNPSERNKFTKVGGAWSFSRSGTTWSSGTKVPSPNGAHSYSEYGHSVAVDGVHVVVGAPKHGIVSYTGTAYVFKAGTYDGSLQYGLGFYDFGGMSVGVSGGAVIMGVPGNGPKGTYPGEVRVFEDVGYWKQSDSLTASDGAAKDALGDAAAIEGNYVVAGAPNKGKGAAYIFLRSGTTWKQQHKLTSPDALEKKFGSFLDISGDSVVVSGTNAAHVFVIPGFKCSLHSQCKTGYCKGGKCAASPDGGLDHGLTPDQSAPDQFATDQVLPDQVLPDQFTPDQFAPDQSHDSRARDVGQIPDLRQELGPTPGSEGVDEAGEGCSCDLGNAMGAPPWLLIVGAALLRARRRPQASR